jgi:hypothetical protein
MSKPKTPLTPEEAVTKALNEQGFLFAQIVREKFRNRLRGDLETQSGWRFVAQEYPVTASDGSQTRIDFVLCAGDHHLTLECKRANPDYKRWVFFDKADETSMDGGDLFIETALFTQRPVQSPAHVKHEVRRFAMPPPCHVFNYYVECAIDQEKQASATKTIEDAFQQVMKGHSGLMAKLLSFDSGACLRSIPVVVTTAELLEAQFDPSKISLEDGCIDQADVAPTQLEFCAVNYHANDMLAVKSGFAPDTLRDIEADLLYRQIRTVFVVHAPAINKFLNWASGDLRSLA